jgi:hypothetical protein
LVEAAAAAAGAGAGGAAAGAVDVFLVVFLGAAATLAAFGAAARVEAGADEARPFLGAVLAFDEDAEPRAFLATEGAAVTGAAGTAADDAVRFGIVARAMVASLTRCVQIPHLGLEASFAVGATIRGQVSR